MEKHVVKVDPDLLDLTQVLIDSLWKDLREMKKFCVTGDYKQVREKAHSSRGAALTFGYNKYAQTLTELKKASLDKRDGDMQNICGKLREMLENVEFTAAD